MEEILKIHLRIKNLKKLSTDIGGMWPDEVGGTLDACFGPLVCKGQADGSSD